MDRTIAAFFKAMQTGATAEADMMALFTIDAVYVEPFSGAPRSHHGKEAIRAAFQEGWRHPMPDLKIIIDRFSVTGDETLVEWTCFSPALPGGKGRGENLFTLRDGLILRLETRFLQPT